MFFLYSETEQKDAKKRGDTKSGKKVEENVSVE